VDKKEGRAYSKGYAAGRKRDSRDYKRDLSNIEAELKESKKERAFLSVLNGLITSGGWSRGGKKANDTISYCKIANDFAIEAMKHY